MTVYIVLSMNDNGSNNRIESVWSTNELAQAAIHHHWEVDRKYNAKIKLANYYVIIREVNVTIQ